MRSKISLILFLVIYCNSVFAYTRYKGQTVYGSGTTTPQASAITEYQSTTQGMLPPKMTTTQRDAIASPATGLMIYNTTTNQNETYTASGWLATGGVGSSGTSTDNAVARFDGASGNLIQNSLLVVDDVGGVTGATKLDVDNLRLDGNTLSSIDANGNIVLLPNGTGDVAIGAATTTITDTGVVYNAKFDADNTGNVLTNVEDADIKTGAAINAAKIADGSVSSTEYQYINTLSSNAQTQIDGKQATDGDLTAVAGLTTNGLVTRTATDTMTTRTVTGTSNQISITNGDGVAGNPTVLLADNPVLPGTDSVTLVKGTTAQRGSTVSGKLRFNTDTTKFEGNNGTAWGNIGGGIDSWAGSTVYAVGDWVKRGHEIFRCKSAHTSNATSFNTDWEASRWDVESFTHDNRKIFYPGGQADLTVVATDGTTGAGATFAAGVNGSTGTVSVSSTTNDLQDSNTDTYTYKYTGTAGTETNDYVYFRPVTIPQGSRDAGSDYQDIKFRFWYWSELSDTAVKFKAYCVSGSYAGVITHPASTQVETLIGTDEDADGTKDAGEGRWYEIVYPVHKDCLTVYPGIQIQEAIATGAEFIWNKIEPSVWVPGSVDSVGLPETAHLTDYAGYASGNIEAPYFTNTVTNTFSKTGTFVNNSTLGVGFTALMPVEIKVAASFDYAASQNNFGWIKNATAAELDLDIDNAGVTPTKILGMAYCNDGNGNCHSSATTILQTGDTVWLLGKNAVETNDYYAQATITATPLSNKKLIVSSVEANKAGFFGSVRWAETASCSWTTTSTTHANFAAVAACDDNARTGGGVYNTTTLTATDADGQLPKIEFSQMPAGRYEVIARGHFEANSGGATRCSWRFTDGTNTTSKQTSGNNSTNDYNQQISGVFNYTSAQGATTIQIQASMEEGTSCNLEAGSSSEQELEIIVYFFPDYASNLVSVTALPTVDYSWENHFSAYVADGTNTTTVSKENQDFMSGNCTNTDGTGAYVCTFVSNFFTQIPKVTLQAQAADRHCTTSNVTTTGLTVNCARSADAVAFDMDFVITVDRSQGDYRSVGSTAAVLASNEPCLIDDQKTSGTAGGTSSLTPVARDLNTISGRCTSVALDGTDGFKIIDPGTYFIKWSAPVCSTTISDTLHKSALYNETTSAYLWPGSSEFAGQTGDSVCTRSRGSYRGHIATANTVLSIHHEVQASLATTGWGASAGGALTIDDGAAANEIYTQVEVYRVK